MKISKRTLDGPVSIRYMRLFAAVVILLSVLVASPVPALCQGAKVAVFPMRNNGQAQYAGLSAGLAAMFDTDLARSGGIELTDPARVSATLEKIRLVGGSPSVDDALKAAVRLEADYALTGEFVVFGGRFRIDVRLYDVNSGILKASEKGQAKEDAFFDVVDEISDRIILDITGSIPQAGGVIQVSSEPSGAAVTLDGEKAGTTPASLKDVPAGPHEIRVEAEGYRPYVEKVKVSSKETVKVSAKLVRLYGGMRVWWKGYPTSDIAVGSETIRTSQFVNSIFAKYCKNIPSDNYTVTVIMPYKDESSWNATSAWRTYTADVEIRPGEVTNIYINNDRFSPSIEVDTCGGCAANWNFETSIAWYETQ